MAGTGDVVKTCLFDAGRPGAGMRAGRAHRGWAGIPQTGFSWRMCLVYDIDTRTGVIVSSLNKTPLLMAKTKN